MTETKQERSLIRKLLKYVIPLIISVGLCWLLFTGIDFDEMLRIIRTECDFRWIVLMWAITVLSHVVRAMRWRIQLNALGVYPPLYVLVYSIFGTYAVNLVFPRLGEVWRTGYIAQRQDAKFTTVFGSMVADRLSDTVTVLIITAVTFMLASGTLLDFLQANSESYERIAGAVTSPWLWGAVAAVIVVCVAVYRKTGSGKIGTRVRDALQNLWQGFAVVLHMPGTGRWLLLTAAIWGCYFMQLFVAFYAFPFTAALIHEHTALAVLVTFVLSSISMGVPSNGGIGPWQWAVIFALGIYGVDKAHAGAFANLVMGCNTLILIVLGIITFVGIALDKRKTRKNN